MKKCITALGIYITVAVIVTTSLRWYRWYTSPWRLIPSSVWEQIAEELRAGEQPTPLDAVQVLADVDAWLRG